MNSKVWWPRVGYKDKGKFKAQDQLSHVELKKAAQVLIDQINMAITLEVLKKEQSTDVYCKQISD